MQVRLRCKCMACGALQPASVPVAIQSPAFLWILPFVFQALNAPRLLHFLVAFFRTAAPAMPILIALGFLNPSGGSCLAGLAMRILVIHLSWAVAAPTSGGHQL